MFGAEKVTKRIHSQQRSFDFLDTVPDIPSPRARPWYYLTRGRNAEMLIDIDAYGNAVWVEHDLREHLPFVYNCRRRAQEAASRLGATVMMCHYDRLSRSWKKHE